MKKTAGQQILEHDQLRLEVEDDVIEYRRSMEPSIIAQVYQTAQDAKKELVYSKSDFYVVLITTNDRVLRHPRIITLARKSCPTPVYKQSVWKYIKDIDQLEFLWSIPDSILYYHILKNREKYLQDKETQELAKFVILMESGELLDWVKKENGEKQDAIIKISNKEGVLC